MNKLTQEEIDKNYTLLKDNEVIKEWDVYYHACYKEYRIVKSLGIGLSVAHIKENYIVVTEMYRKNTKIVKKIV
jgi:hypothetical protein